MRELFNILLFFLCVLAVSTGGFCLFYIRLNVAHASEWNAMGWMIVYVLILAAGFAKLADRK